MPLLPTTTQLARFFGTMGTSGVRTGSLVPRAATPDADQRLWLDFQKAGELGDPDLWTKFNTVMKRPTTFDAMLQLWDEMAQWDLIAAALVEITDEATQTDANSPGTLWFQCNDKNFEEELNDLVDRLDLESIIQSQVWHVAALGNHFEKIEYAPKSGIMGLSYVHPMDMRRYWLERNRKCVGFRWAGHLPNKDDIFVMPDNSTPVERVALGTKQSTEDLWYPWDFLHFRRMYRMRISEHGEPVFAEADGIYKKLRLAVDQMVVHRAQIQPDRYHISVDTQEQPPIEQMKTVQRWRQALRSKLAFGAGSGLTDRLNDVSDFQSFYNAWALDTVVYLAQPKGFQNSIGKLNGTTQVPDVYDIELLTDLFYSIIGMPRSWFGGQRQGGSESPSGKALLAQDVRFLRKIKSIRRPIVNGYTWLGYFHAILKGMSIDKLEIKAMMPPIGGLEEQMKMELLQRQADVLGTLGDVMTQYNLPKEAWIEVIFKRYMHLPDEIVHVFLTALPTPMDAQESAQGAKAAPYAHRLVREVDEVVGKTKRASEAVERLREALREMEPKTRRSGNRFSTVNEVLTPPELKTRDVIISSFGRHPMELATPSNTKPETVQAPITEALENGAASWLPYRKWISVT